MKPLRCLTLLLLLLLPFGAMAQEEGIRADLSQHKSAQQIDNPKVLLEAAPHFTIEPRKPYLEGKYVYPCSNCHQAGFMAPNPKVRNLELNHGDIPLNHGKGQFWCTQCHDLKNRDQLISLKGQKIDFNDAYLLCGQCHSARLKDFLYGGHGKNLAGWNQEKHLTNCTGCHNPHVPRIQAKQPQPAPKMRSGLEYKAEPVREHHKFWPSDFSNYQPKEGK